MRFLQPPNPWSVPPPSRKLGILKKATLMLPLTDVLRGYI